MIIQYIFQSQVFILLISYLVQNVRIILIKSLRIKILIFILRNKELIIEVVQKVIGFCIE